MDNRTTQKTITGFIWRFLERIGAQGVSFVVSIVLARILAPEMYGTIALVTVFTTIMQVFVDSGFANALIQKKNADDLDFSSVFYFNIAMCCTLYAVMYFAAPSIGRFYNDITLVPVIRVMSLLLIVSGLQSIQHAYVSRNMLFKKFFFSTIGGTVCSAVVGIGMAYAGFGVWALVAQYLVNNVAGTMILWVTVPWRPKLAFSLIRLRKLFSFGWKLLASRLIDTLYNDLRQLIIGKMYSSSDLAYYNKAKQFPNLVVSNINSSIDSVLLPVMSQEQDDATRVKAMTRRAIRTSSYIMAPMMIGLAVCAEPLIRLILTDKWIDSVFFMRIFCITYMFYPIHTANLNAIKAMGRSDLFLKLEIVKKIVGISSVLITMWISVEAMAYSLLVTTLLATVINAFPNKKLLNYSWFEQMKDILPHIALAVLMGTLVLCIQYLQLPTILTLVMQVLTGAGIYALLSVVFKVETFQYLLNILKNFLGKRI